MPLRSAHLHALNGLAVAAVFLLAIAVSLASAPLRTGLIVEDGPIEALSAYGYFVCAAILLRTGRDLAGFAWIVVLLIACGLRELGFHTSLTTMSITKTRFYVNPDVPMLEKLIAGAAILVIAVSVFQLLRIHGRGFFQALRRREPPAIAVLCGLAYIGISKTLDGMSRKLAGLGFDYSDDDLDVATVFEETLELGIPLMFLSGIVSRNRAAHWSVDRRRPEHIPAAKALKYWTIGWLSAIAIMLIRATCRVRVHDDPRPALRAESKRYIYSVLHAHQVAAIIGGEPGTAAMVSRSADGSILLPSLWLRGIIAIRGSSRRAGEDKGGRTALDVLCSHLLAGKPAYLAIDGPRGPRNRVQKGVAVLSQRSGAVVVNLVAIPTRRWILSRAWDRMQIPKPFSTIQVHFGEPLVSSDEESSEQFRGRIEASLRALEIAYDPAEAARFALESPTAPVLGGG